MVKGVDVSSVRAPRSRADPTSPYTAARATVGRYRWTICALLFFATTINYIDRQILGILAPTLQSEIGWNEQQYAAVVSWFTLAYAVGFLFIGRLLDKIGTRRTDTGVRAALLPACSSSSITLTRLSS